MRAIKLETVNKILYGGIFVLIFFYRSELIWSVKNAPNWLDGTIAEPPERELLNEARHRMEWKERGPNVLALLEESRAIDPTPESGFLLGEYFYANQETGRALEEYLKSLQSDPSCLECYLRAAQIYEAQGDLAQARAVIGRGRDYFKDRLPKIRPVAEPGVPWQYNAKAEAQYRRTQEAQKTLEREALRLSQARKTPKK